MAALAPAQPSGRRGGRRRIEVVVLATLTVLTLVGWRAVAEWGKDATAEGRAVYRHRAVLEETVTAQPTRRPLVAWLGDSTIIGESYPRRMDDWLRDRYRGESRVVAYPGLTTFNYYELMGPVLALRPAVVVLIANLRAMPAPRTDLPVPADLGAFDDLASMIPEEELPRALALPWQVRGVSLPRLVLLRLLRYDALEQSMYLFEGLRSLAQQQHPWEGVAPPPSLPSSVALAAYLDAIHGLEKRYDQEIRPDAPFARMLAGAIEMARSRGVRVLVVASPIPWEALRDTVGYDHARYARRFDVLRGVVEARGATFVDYHEALKASGFRDDGGHLTVAGATALSQILRRPLGMALADTLHHVHAPPTYEPPAP